MKFYRLIISSIMIAASLSVSAVASETEEPVTYIVKKGDTLWGLSKRFVEDPFYWPRMWEVNRGKVTNPHFIYPGQKVKVYHDRIEIEPKEEISSSKIIPPSLSAKKEVKEIADEVSNERAYPVTGGEGILAPKEMQFSGTVTAISHNRSIAGEDDVVYVNIGKSVKANVGDRFRVFAKTSEVRHPVTNQLAGIKLLQTGTLSLTEIEENNSKGIITSSFREIEPGSVLLPYISGKRGITITSADKDFSGLIIETKTGNRNIAAGEVCYIDLGASDGLKVGNILYVVRDVQIDPNFASTVVGKLPVDVVGAVIIVDITEKSSSALVIKSIDSIYLGDRVEFRSIRQ